MRTAPPTVPGMLTPNSMPDNPARAARAATAGRRAPPPHRMRGPSTAMAASSRSSLTTRPATPSSATSRFEPDPTTSTATPAPAAQASSSSSRSPGPGSREVLAGAAGADGREALQREITLHARRRGGTHRRRARRATTAARAGLMRRPARGRGRRRRRRPSPRRDRPRSAARAGRAWRRRCSAARRPACRRRHRRPPRRSSGR